MAVREAGDPVVLWLPIMQDVQLRVQIKDAGSPEHIQEGARGGGGMDSDLLWLTPPQMQFSFQDRSPFEAQSYSSTIKHVLTAYIIGITCSLCTAHASRGKRMPICVTKIRCCVAARLHNETSHTNNHLDKGSTQSFTQIILLARLATTKHTAVYLPENMRRGFQGIGSTRAGVKSMVMVQRDSTA